MGKQSNPTTFFSPSLLLSSILAWILLLSISKSTTVHADDQEKLILSELKANWSSSSALSSWNSSSPHCNWPGIQCINGSVTEISLPNTSINKPIPPFICNLRNLTLLDLAYNDIPGGFPTSLYNCSNLQHLDLSQNYFAGDLPADIDKLSSKLAYLDLCANSFTGDVPPSIGRLPSLQNLRLHSNRFNGSFPAELGKLSMLEWLTLAYNPFASQRIPSEFGNLRRLKLLWMTQTQLTGEIPESFRQLSEIEHLDLSWNNLNGSIPEFIWSLEKLKKIFLYKNNLTGEIHGKIGATSLEEIDVSINQLTGSIPEEFAKLSNLSVLFMYYNRLSGEIPRGIGLLTNLGDIRLFNNNLTGTLPPELGKHSYLYNLEVSNNRLSGSLPQGLCTKGALMSLVVFNNSLTGEMPASLAHCHRLENIQLYNNSFSGDFPLQFWTNLVNLTTVLIHHNRFTGGLPNKLQLNLTRLEINNNNFSGKVPLSAPRLQVFKASNNNFSGEIPAQLTEMSKLELLLLDGNQISGPIPTSISALNFLTVLNLSNNHLSGSIPAAIGSLPQLTMLDLSRNELFGSIPPEMGNLKLNFLNLSYNQLSGEIPFQLQNQAYEQSFLNNPGLCTSKYLVNLKTCGPRSTGPDKSSQRMFLILMLLGGSLFLMLSMIGLLMYRRRPNHGDLPVPPWKLTSFHKVDFTERRILSGLSEANLIGSGGSGQVYRINIGNCADETVAVKKIWNTRKSNWKMEKTFEAEVKILSSIRHANIVKLLCCISNEDSKLLVYEFMENGCLHQWLHRKGRTSLDSEHGESLDWSRRLGIAIDAAQGLCYMHHHCASPVIHRDVKSSNILLDAQFNAKIADFGLARILFKVGEPETASAIAGTFGYMAPECGYSKTINEKMDVYSFGVVLLELTTGRKAHEGGEHEGLAAWAFRHRMENGRVIELMDEELSEDAEYFDDIDAVINLGIECTRMNPAFRPSMKDVLRILMASDRKNVRRRNLELDPLLQIKRWTLQKSSSDVSEEDDRNCQVYEV
ncbi:receptor-like protein kinase HSL1 [Canna indica]|uniref:non-specific serine/threonine protein kinase n=1 Tax=Canna indica TaxID=4628 RepID=A0AAQ3QI65_9LILI|nr:receptor-like protein kinase HSL1 [Canna indica]